MNKIVRVKYDSDKLSTEIIADGKAFDTSRIDGKEIADWAYPFMLRKIRWNGFYDEMVEALDGEKEFDLIFEGEESALNELKEAWEDAPVNIISEDAGNVAVIEYDESSLTTKITVNGEPFDISRIDGKEIADWVYPFILRKIKWNGIFEELASVLGSENFTIQFSGSNSAMKELMEECPEGIIITKKERSCDNAKIIEEKNEDEIQKEELCSELPTDRNDLINRLYNSLTNVLYKGYVNIVNERIERCFLLSEDEWEKIKILFTENKHPSEYDINGNHIVFEWDNTLVELISHIDNAHLFEDLPEWFFRMYSGSKEISEKITVCELKAPDGIPLICKIDELKAYYVPQTTVKVQKVETAEPSKTPKELYEEALKLEQNGKIKQAVKLYQKALEQKYHKAEVRLGICYFKLKNYDEAFKYLKKSAENGDADAQFYLAEIYDSRYNEELAFKWYKKAADSGNCEAQLEIAERYYDDESTKKDINAAIRYYKLAAENRNSDEYIKYQSAAELGRLYYLGDKIKTDYAQAFKWLEKASEAEQPDSATLFYLGMCYKEGYGTKKDAHKAIQVFEKLSDIGDLDAKNQLGLIYDNQNYGMCDIDKAISYYTDAANKGLVSAMYNLGVNLWVEKNDIENAVEWLQRALENGHKDAQEMLDSINSELAYEEKPIYDPTEHTEYYYCYDQKNFQPYKEPQKNFVYSLFFYLPVESTNNLIMLFDDYEKFSRTSRGMFEDDTDYFNKISKFVRGSIDDTKSNENSRSDSSRKLTDKLFAYFGKDLVVDLIEYIKLVFESIKKHPEHFKNEMSDYTWCDADQDIADISNVIPKMEGLINNLKDNFEENKNAVFTFMQEADIIVLDSAIFAFESTFEIPDKRKQSEKLKERIYRQIIICALSEIADVAISCISNSLLDEADEDEEDNFFDEI